MIAFVTKTSIEEICPGERLQENIRLIDSRKSKRGEAENE